MSGAAFEVLPEDPRTSEAIALISALSAELARLYDYIDDGSGHFKIEDALGVRSVFVVGRVEGRAVACGAFRPLEETVAEVKRMFVLPECRGRGYSKIVLATLEQMARERGYDSARLETGHRQPAAIRLYQQSGYFPI